MVNLRCKLYMNHYYGVYPVCSMSALINVFVLYVWNAETVYHPTTYLFKMLAVTDILSSFFYLPFRPLSDHPMMRTAVPIYLSRVTVHSLMNNGRKINVLVTLVLALTRLFKVMPSLHFEHLCSHHRMRIAVTVISIIGMTIEGVSQSFYAAYDHDCDFDSDDAKQFWQMFVLAINDHVAFSIPALLQMMVMFFVIWRMRVVLRGSQTEHLLMVRRLSYAVFAICSFTFITHFVMRVALTVARDQTQHIWHEHTQLISSVISILLGLNGLVNVIFYSLFVPRFRHLVNFRLQRFVRFFHSLRHSTVVPAASQMGYSKSTTSSIGRPPGTTSTWKGQSQQSGKTSVKGLPPTMATITTEGVDTEFTQVTDHDTEVN